MHVRAAVPPVAGRLAVIASRRVGNAPVRNRAKRLMREAAVRVPWHHGIDVVLVARPPITEATMWDVQDELVELAGRLGVAEPQGLPS